MAIKPHPYKSATIPNEATFGDSPRPPFEDNSPEGWVRKQVENIRRRADYNAKIWKARAEAAEKLIPPQPAPY